MNYYDTLSEAIEGLKERGFTEDFQLSEKHLKCEERDEQYAPQQFEVVEVYRFEGMSNPDDNSVIYAIKTDNGRKGMLVDAYGAYAESLSLEMAQRLRMDRDPDHIKT